MDEDDFTSQKGKEIKVILLGDTGVGKTSIINRYINNKFDPDNDSTLSSSFSTKEVIKNDVLYRLNLWDTIGQEKYNAITNILIKGSNIVILVYSVDSLSSFENIDFWYNNIKDILQEDKYILAIVGNKSDLINEDESIVSEEEARNFAKGKNAYFKLISAKEDQDGINSLLDILLEELLRLNYVTVTESYVIKRSKHKDTEKGKKKAKDAKLDKAEDCIYVKKKFIYQIMSFKKILIYVFGCIGS